MALKLFLEGDEKLKTGIFPAEYYLYVPAAP
jgi:hypothetical protein